MLNKIKGCSNSVKYWIYKQVWHLIDCIYPPECGGCGQKGARLCPLCIQHFSLQKPIISELKYPPNNSQFQEEYQNHNDSVMKIASVAIYEGPVRHAIHKLKYKYDIGLGEILSRFMIDLFSRLSWDIDLIVPVPLNPKKHQLRGYNQSSLLALPMALSNDIKFSANAIQRVKETRSQIDLDSIERFINVHNAFSSQRELVEKRSILLIDDVATTGATLLSCRSSLMSSNAKEVFGLTLAKTL